MGRARRRGIRSESLLMDIVVYGFVTIAVLSTLYPFVYVLSMAISDPDRVALGEVWLLPKGFSLASLRVVISEQGIWRAYFNTILYSAIGTAVALLCTVLAAYPLARKGFVFRKSFLTMLVIPMFIGGGLIPNFILIKGLRLYNTLWALVLPGAVSSWNIILVKTYIQHNMPVNLIEAAQLDGFNDIGILFRIVLPLSTPIIAVIALYTVVGFWNSYFSVLIYIPQQEKQTLQLYLMRILLRDSNELANANAYLANRTSDIPGMISRLQLKYAVIIFVIAPIIMVYPFLQKYFIKGALIGSLKE